ncbi:MAG: histidine phosphatase family protein [Tabrizicola sp.]|nr:histidine phosphatase family protein [Tabrizicola sp.]
MPLIHLIRHGETDGNRDHYVGRKDLPLNAAGRAQAEALARQLSRFPITRIIASPLQRAKETARPLADRLRLPVEEHAALIEIDFGILQDQRKSDHAMNLRKHHDRVPLPGGESLKDVWDRLLPLARAFATGDGSAEGLALIGHYWSNRMLFGLLSGRSFDATLGMQGYKPANGTAVSLTPAAFRCD